MLWLRWVLWQLTPSAKPSWLGPWLCATPGIRGRFFVFHLWHLVTNPRMNNSTSTRSRLCLWCFNSFCTDVDLRLIWTAAWRVISQCFENAGPAGCPPKECQSGRLRYCTLISNSKEIFGGSICGVCLPWATPTVWLTLFWEPVVLPFNRSLCRVMLDRIRNIVVWQLQLCSLDFWFFAFLHQLAMSNKLKQWPRNPVLCAAALRMPSFQQDQLSYRLKQQMLPRVSLCMEKRQLSFEPQRARWSVDRHPRHVLHDASRKHDTPRIGCALLRHQKWCPLPLESKRGWLVRQVFIPALCRAVFTDSCSRASTGSLEATEPGTNPNRFLRLVRTSGQRGLPGWILLTGALRTLVVVSTYAVHLICLVPWVPCLLARGTSTASKKGVQHPDKTWKAALGSCCAGTFCRAFKHANKSQKLALAG